MNSRHKYLLFELFFSVWFIFLHLLQVFALLDLKVTDRLEQKLVQKVEQFQDFQRKLHLEEVRGSQRAETVHKLLNEVLCAGDLLLVFAVFDAGK